MTNFSENGTKRRNRSEPKPRFQDQQLNSAMRSELLAQTATMGHAMGHQELIQTVRPYALIGCGTAGVKIVDKIRRALRKENSNSFLVCRAIDTDGSARADTTLDDSEFLQLNMQRLNNAIQNPEQHKKIKDRFGLSDADVIPMLERFQSDPVDQASAVRLHGAHGLLADHYAIAEMLIRMLQEIYGVRARLERQIAAGNTTRFHDDLKIFVVSSSCGGSGSSIFLQIIASLKQLTDKMKVEIVPILLLPSVFEEILKPHREHWLRAQANGYATLRELGAFMEGYGTRYDIDLGADDQQVLKLGAGFARSIAVVGNRDCNGKYLDREGCVATVVEYIATLVAQPNIADIMEMFDSNNATLNTTEESKKQRYVSSISAASLSLDSKRVAAFCAAKATRKLIEKVAVGESIPHHVAKVEAWMNSPAKDTPPLVGTNMLELLRKTAHISLEAKTRGLYRVKNGSATKHLCDNAFVHQCVNFRDLILKDLIPRSQEQILKCRHTLQTKLDEALKSEADRTTAQFGLIAGNEFLSTLAGRLLEIHKSILKKIDLLQKSVEQREQALGQAIQQLGQKWLSSWVKSKLAQEQIISQVKGYYDAEVERLAYRGYADLLFQLSTEAEQQRHEMRKSIDGSVEVIASLRELERQHEAGGQLHTMDSYAELDVGSKETDRAIFEQFLPDLRSVAQRISENERTKWYQAICRKGENGERVLGEFFDYFTSKLNHITLPEIVADLLEDDAASDQLRSKIVHLIQGTQVAWGTADSQNNAVTFADQLIVGIPEGPEGKRQLLEEEIRKAASGRVNVDNQYRARLQTVLIPGKKLRVLRVVKGAAWHFLREIHELESSYSKWYRENGHTVHIFNKSTVAKLPHLIPAKKLTDEERAIVLGLALGAIARRGTCFYWNLTQVEPTYQLRLKSHWVTVPIDGKGPLATLVDDGKWTHPSSDGKLDDALKMGESLPSLQAELKLNIQRRQILLEVFSMLRARSGDEAVASELENFLNSWIQAEHKSNASAADHRMLLDLTARLIDTLR
jgi:hemerythrin